MAAPCQPTPISTIFETTTVTSLVPVESGSTTYVLVDPQAATVSTTFRTRDGLLEPVRTTILGATVTTTEALTVTQTSLIVTSVPVSTVLNSCPVLPTPSSATSSSLSSSTTSSPSSTSSTTLSTTTTSSTTTSSTTSSTPSSILSSTLSPSSVSSQTSASSSASSTGLLPSNASNASNSSSSPANLSAIIGGSVGGGVGAIILLGLLFWCCCGRNRRKGKGEDEWRDPPPFLVGGAGANGHGGSGEFEEKEPVQNRWDPAGGMAGANTNGSPGRLSRKFVGAGAGAALAGGVSAYERNNEGGDAHRRKSGKFRPADEQDAYYRNTWVAPQPEAPVDAGFAGVGAGIATKPVVASSRIAPPQRQGTVKNMMENATTFDPRARDGGWAVANEAFHNQSSSQPGPSSQAQFQPRNPMPPPAPLPLPGIDYRPATQAPSTQAHDAFLAPPSQSRFNRYNSPSHPQQPSRSGYDSPAPSHVSIPALGPYLAASDSERGGNQLRVTNLGSSTAGGSEWGGDSHVGGYEQQGGGGRGWDNAREEISDDNDPYGGLDAGLDQRQRRY
ncbi:hypothetical protein JCM16303_000018 [Sporobolomyces ruberrimus]